MKTRKAFAALTICTLSTVTILEVLIPSLVIAQPLIDNNLDQKSCSRFVVGTYLTTNTDANLPIRQILTVTEDGNFFATISTQGGVPGTSNPADQPFGNVQGRWKCSGKREITATGLNFSYTTGTLPATIFRDNYHIKFEPKALTLQGTLTFTTYFLNSNPLDQNTSPLAESVTLPFTGQRVNAD